MRSLRLRHSWSTWYSKGRVSTIDALLSRQHIAQYIVEEGGNYVMVVKDIGKIDPGSTCANQDVVWPHGWLRCILEAQLVCGPELLGLHRLHRLSLLRAMIKR